MSARREGMTWAQALGASPGPRRKREYLALWLKAFAMGTADLVPGVSGGTVAFVTGVYEPLIEAVASVRRRTARDLVLLRFKRALAALHVRFLATVALGMAASVFSLSHLMHYLMGAHPVPTWAAFLGLVGASSLVVFRHLGDRGPASCSLVLAGAAFSWAFVSLVPTDTPDALWFVFLCGAVAMAAMVLPGVSGSFLLLVFGKYGAVVAAIRDPFGDGHPFFLAALLLGMATGLLAFSKALRLLMRRHRNGVMAVLTGILLGSLKKLWPWKEVLEYRVVGGEFRILREANRWPPALDGESLLAVSLIVLGFAAVLCVEAGNRRLRGR